MRFKKALWHRHNSAIIGSTGTNRPEMASKPNLLLEKSLERMTVTNRQTRMKSDEENCSDR